MRLVTTILTRYLRPYSKLPPVDWWMPPLEVTFNTIHCHGVQKRQLTLTPLGPTSPTGMTASPKIASSSVCLRCLYHACLTVSLSLPRLLQRTRSRQPNHSSHAATARFVWLLQEFRCVACLRLPGVKAPELFPRSMGHEGNSGFGFNSGSVLVLLWRWLNMVAGLI